MLEVNKLPESDDKLYVIDVSADWCGHCRQLAPQVEQAEKDNPNIVFLRMDADKISDELISALGIDELPHICAFKNCKQLAVFNESHGDIASWVKFIQW